MGFEMVIVVVAVFVAAGLAASAIAWPLLARTSAERKRFEEVARVTAGGGIFKAESLVDTASTKLRKFDRFIPKSPSKMSGLRRRLSRAGYYSLSAVVMFQLIQLATPIAFALVALAIFGVTKGWMIALLAAGTGFMLPGFVLERIITRRKRAISNGLPDVLDLLIVCLEAGSGLDQAIVKASEELALAHPALAQELRLLTTEVRAGKSRLEAFHNLAKRTDVDDVRSLVSMLVQTDRFGTSVSQALRVHAATSRTKRRQRAEERAAKIGVKLVFPLVFCLMPAFYVVTLGPSALDFINFFSQMR